MLPLQAVANMLRAVSILDEFIWGITGQPIKLERCAFTHLTWLC